MTTAAGFYKCFWFDDWGRPCMLGLKSSWSQTSRWILKSLLLNWTWSLKHAFYKELITWGVVKEGFESGREDIEQAKGKHMGSRKRLKAVAGLASNWSVGNKYWHQSVPEGRICHLNKVGEWGRWPRWGWSTKRACRGIPYCIIYLNYYTLISHICIDYHWNATLKKTTDFIIDGCLQWRWDY